MTAAQRALVREFVYLMGRCPANVTRTEDGSEIILDVSPANSSRTLRIVATVTEAVEL